MNNGEYYVSREVNYIGENKIFPAEIYKKPFEENTLGKESADGGSEITTLQKKTKKPKRNADGSNKSLTDKIFDSVKSIATTATVAVAAIVVSNTVMANTVNVELADIDVGSNYVEYELVIDDMGEEDECFIIVSSPEENISETEISESGTYRARVENLKPEWEYTLSVVSRDGILGDIVKFKHKFQTVKHEEYEPDPPPEDNPPLENPPTDNPDPNDAPPDTYNGHYEFPSVSDLTVDWSKKQMLIPIVFENVDGRYLYRLTVADGDGNQLSVTEGRESGNAVIDVSDENDLYKFIFQIFGVGTNEEKLILTRESDVLDVARPSVAVTEMSIIGVNTIRVDFVSENAEHIYLHLEYPGDNVEDVELTKLEMLCGYAEINVPENALSIAVTPYAVIDGYSLAQEMFEKEFTENLAADVIVNLYSGDKSVEFYVQAITGGALYLYVESSNPNLTGAYDIWEGKAVVYYEEREQISFTAYLTDDSGAKLSNEIQIDFDTALPDSIPDYNLIFTNTGEVALTYNEDGTVNAYFNTGFECEDESYYYRINLGGYFIESREKMAIFKNMPNEIYTLRYYVCYEKDGIKYSVISQTPSGMVNEAYHYGAYANMECVLEENQLTITLDQYYNIDLNSVRIVSSTGSQIIIDESDFVPDGNGGYSLTVSFDHVPEYVTVHAKVCPNPFAYDGIEDYEGSIYIPYEAEIYPY